MTTLTIEQAAHLVGVSTWTVRKWVQRGYLRPVRIVLGGESRFIEGEVVDCAEARRSKRAQARLDEMTRQWQAV